MPMKRAMLCSVAVLAAVMVPVHFGWAETASTSNQPLPSAVSFTPETPQLGDLQTTDTAVAEKIRELLPDDQAQARKAPEREALRAYYESRAFAPLWTLNGVATKNAKQAVAYLGGVASDGLDPADYPSPRFDDTDPAKLASDDIALSTSLMAFARDASVGRVSTAKVSDAISYALKPPTAEEVLRKLSVSSDVRSDLAGFLPQHEAYKALRQKLAELRQKGQAGRIADGPVMSLGKEDARVPQLRRVLNLGKGEGQRFDKKLEAAVKEFQRNAKIPVTGSVNAQTLSRLNAGGKNSKAENLIIANMERWRWLPRDLGTTHVVVNVPDYSLKLFDKGKLVWSTKIIVGKPGELATPLLSATMTHLTINPTWNVPPSIVRKEYLPKLSYDPYALERMGLKVTRRNGSLHIYQPPGDRNALGRIRFNFPNEFSVYQHDTPTKHLFARDERALSHGCMRVQDPEKYAELLLSLTQPQDRYSIERIRNMYGDSERTIKLKTPVQVHITYQTAFVDNAGQLQTRADIYGRDHVMMALLFDRPSRVAERSKVRL
jgi:murein L,D-transpeptidase YcbB/YkuD